jgi:DNA recombination protein RmuC
MSPVLVLDAIPLTGLLVYLALARLLRAQTAGPDNGLLRDERDRLAEDLMRLREEQLRLAADLARATERAEAVPRLEAALADALERLHERDVAARAAALALTERAEALRQAQARMNEIEGTLERARAQARQLERERTEAATHLVHAEQARKDMHAFLEDARVRLSATFAELAGKTFDERSQRSAQQSKSDLETLLKPFAEQLDGFRQRVDTLYGEEAKERATLAGAVNELKTLN